MIEEKEKWRNHYDSFRGEWVLEWLDLVYDSNYLELFKDYKGKIEEFLDLDFLDPDFYFIYKKEWLDFT